MAAQIEPLGQNNMDKKKDMIIRSVTVKEKSFLLREIINRLETDRLLAGLSSFTSGQKEVLWDCDLDVEYIKDSDGDKK